MRPPPTVLALALVLAAAAPTARAQPTEALDPPPGFAIVAWSDDVGVHTATVPVRLGVEHEGFAPRTVLAFGGVDLLPAEFTLVLGPARPDEALPETLAFLRGHDMDGAAVAAFLAVEREAQLTMLLTPEALRAAVTAGHAPDLDAVEATIPPDVALDLEALRERKAARARRHVAALTVRTPRPDGTVDVATGLATVDLRTDEDDAEPAGASPAGPRYAGDVWGSFESAVGTVWLDARFAGAPFDMQLPPGFDVMRTPWESDAAAPARFEARWPEPLEVTGVSLTAPLAWDALAHELRVELLLEPGGWTTVAVTPLPPTTSPGAGTPTAPSLADDPDAVAFLTARGGNAAQFEILVERGQGPLMLRSWQAQGIAHDEVPRALLERIDAAAEPPAAPAAPAADPSGWVERPAGPLEPTALTFTLPAPTHALGVRFELHGAPFPDDAGARDPWTLGVDAVERSQAGDLTYAWRYDHAW